MSFQRLRAVVGLLVVLLVSAACGGAGDDAQTAPTSSAGASSAFPITVQHAFGETEIPAEPQRVVVAGLNEADFLYSLGIAPVGVHEWWGGYPYATGPWADDAREEVGAEPEVQQEWDINVEWVAAQKPDLIIATYHDLDETTYERLSTIAPVVAQHADYEVWTTPWREQLRQIGEAVGRSDRAEEVIGDVDAVVERLVEEHPEFEGATFDTGYLDEDGSFGTYTDGDILNQLLSELGMVVPSEYDEYAKGVYVTLSPERVRLLDLLDVFIFLDDTATMEAEAAKVPTFTATRLYEEGRVIAPESDLVLAMAFNTPLSIPYYLEELAPMLEAALDGDPATEVPD